ncbi:hypothetical protein BHF71_10755 [Vulcanibacillus modesticaldus]|uniref:DUF5673 domain-containing protein n=1 Tax=Vulcanibacillus modesticaldus TaxID=337097 RepID=A0A1D2YT44_9BACI|nr:DUF5673 domain-containing protein [Vulcanibacillus modesticaldus]OEF98836.1 hypothetical protein BHF71_10755 [Vulcanibacillus modesticaldus]
MTDWNFIVFLLFIIEVLLLTSWKLYAVIKYRLISKVSLLKKKVSIIGRGFEYFFIFLALFWIIKPTIQYFQGITLDGLAFGQLAFVVAMSEFIKSNGTIWSITSNGVVLYGPYLIKWEEITSYKWGTMDGSTLEITFKKQKNMSKEKMIRILVDRNDREKIKSIFEDKLIID